MWSRPGAILRGVGGFLFFLQALIILSLLVNWSTFDGEYKWEAFLLSFFGFTAPGILLYQLGERRRKKGKSAQTVHRQGISLKRWFRLGNVLRVIGMAFLIFFGLVGLVTAVTWSEQQDELEILTIFFILFCLPGGLMYWAGTRLNRKEDQAQSVPNGFSREGKAGPAQAGRTTDQEWKKYSREPIPKRSAYTYTAAAAKETASAQSPSSPPRRMICPGCGAQNTVPAQASVACEYCGSTLTNL
ncbi:hypothetical protein L3476_22705 [Paenibacillus thiaminolyticus]|uniref:hypothetical protein n=1 Tax=Paenibacillus thiaminolyticus TaxID=49283 RepID=UPI0011620513|nr:hypothetical protein [Paenibacillus thiaminolyticus]NGP60296.1 hypothetical protein [Paenibacillus thiaminolyticus]WCR26066.1 hypothetical protein L3476_22705 [Paenibacillus thiaminolyticus]